MTGLDPTTVAAAGPHMAKGLGKSWPQDRVEVLDGINKFREKLSLDYPNSNLFSEVFHCICVSEFRDDCSPGCSTGNFRGFTLPADVVAVEAVFQGGESAILRGRYREARTGILGSTPRVQTIELPKLYPTERDLAQPAKLKMFAESTCDEGKPAFLDVVLSDGREARLKFTLKGDAWVQVDEFVREIKAVSLPQGRKGGVRLSQVSGRELSSYAPWELVPAYRRFKIHGSCCPQTVQVQGVSRYRDIWWDHDIVEVGSRLILEAAGRFFRYSEGSTDGADVARSQFDESTLNKLLRGLMARHRGNSTMDGPLTRKCTRRSTLPGYGRRC